MKVKPPIIPPAGPKEGNKPSNVRAKSTQVANALAGLLGGKETDKKKEAKRKLAKLSETEKQKRLKSLGAKSGVKPGDSSRQATYKIVHYVLEEEYDGEERGFENMVDEITDFIQEKNPELKQKFDNWIVAIQSES